MAYLQKLKKLTSCLVIAGVLNMGFTIPAAQASMVSTEAGLSAQQVDADKAHLKGLLARADVRTKLQELGADPTEVDKRVDSLSGEEIAALHERIKQLPAGGSDIVGAIVFIFLVLLLTDLLGLTKFYPFVKHRR